MDSSHPKKEPPVLDMGESSPADEGTQLLWSIESRDRGSQVGVGCWGAGKKRSHRPDGSLHIKMKKLPEERISRLARLQVHEDSASFQYATELLEVQNQGLLGVVDIAGGKRDDHQVECAVWKRQPACLSKGRPNFILSPSARSSQKHWKGEIGGHNVYLCTHCRKKLPGHLARPAANIQPQGTSLKRRCLRCLSSPGYVQAKSQNMIDPFISLRHLGKERLYTPSHLLIP